MLTANFLKSRTIQTILKKNLRTIFYITFILILFLGIFLRHYNYLSYPRHGATFDEFAWTWLGINLIQKQVPISWSPHPQYKEREHKIYQGAAFFIVKPYLEHPPLFGLVAGGFSLLSGAKDMYHVTLSNMRPLSLLLGILSIVFIFLLIKELYGIPVALLSSLLYATIPTITIGSRLLQNENFLIPFWILSLYLLARYLKSGNKKFRNLAAIIAGLLSLAKVPWLVVWLSLSGILLFKNRVKDVIIVGIIVLSIFSLYILYGLYFDKELFMSLLRLQTARYDINFIGFFSIFTKPLLVDRYFLDGWILFGWFSIFLLFQDLKRYFWVLIPFIAYLFIYIFAIPDEPMHGWYRYPFYPFLIISSAVVLKNELHKLSLLSLFFTFMIGLPLIHNTWGITYGFSYIIYRGFILLSFSTIIFSILYKNSKVGKIILVAWIVLFIILNYFSVIGYIE